MNTTFIIINKIKYLLPICLFFPSSLLTSSAVFCLNILLMIFNQIAEVI
jgi:hypothetical protein